METDSVDTVETSTSLNSSEENDAHEYAYTSYVTDEAELLSVVVKRLDSIEAIQKSQSDGINTIGQMMNSVASAFDAIMTKVNEGGIGALLGGFMGGNKK